MAVLIAKGYLAADAPHPHLGGDPRCQRRWASGTLSGGWRIVETMGMRLTKLRPVGGFCAETAGAVTLFLATPSGIPVSTTHTITGAIVGVGWVDQPVGVRWGDGAADRLGVAVHDPGGGPLRRGALRRSARAGDLVPVAAGLLPLKTGRAAKANATLAILLPPLPVFAGEVFGTTWRA